jgi:hypothetical protein
VGGLGWVGWVGWFGLGGLGWVGGWLGGGDALSTDPRLTPSGRLVIICFWFRQCQIGSRLSCVMVVYVTHICEHITQVIGDQSVFTLYMKIESCCIDLSFFDVRNS